MFKMWEICLFFLLINGFVMVSPSTVARVRLVDHTSYAIAILQKTMSIVEQHCWCNLKVDDVHVKLSEEVLDKTISAEVDLKNGFVVSVQKMGIIQNTIQQRWQPATGNTTRVDVEATLRLTDVAVGFDVIIKEEQKVSHSTGLIVYPDVQFRVTISKDMFMDEMWVNIIGVLARTTNLMQFNPESDVTKVFMRRFDSTSTAPSVITWASEVLQPITLKLATEEIDFPRICYNCAT